MNQTWKFTDLEFYALWYDSEREALPWPFFFATRTELDSVIRVEQAEALANARRTHGALCREVIEALVRPDLRIIASGRDGREPRKPAGLVRIHAVRRGDRGFVVNQLPGETFYHGTSFTVSECDAVALAEAVVRAMPDATPGRLADVTLAARADTEEFDYSYGRSAVQDSFDDSVAERAARFLAEPVQHQGSIEVIQGRSLFGPRGITRHRLEWRDLLDDGRYVVDDQHPPLAVAADRKRLISMINIRVAEVVRAIKDERP
ncbi:ESX secretion-associated protein EspG [Nocardia elegans]|uniref:ESX secretion-associated protein EspG n=1 Tax=Nocardia elegans TaxID=300029 RepID=UPI001894B031|nr:ESX secretion-associated protein EspG [Nocardia elegans]MBF6247189.1 ESX secretion-associated protein EspG [Nocardia elegans]